MLINHYPIKLLAVGAATQLVILPPQIAWEGQIGGILMLRYSIICISGLVIFDLNGRGEKRSALEAV